MMMTKSGLYLEIYRKAMSWGSSALTLMVFLLLVGTNDVNAQALLQGNAAISAMKPAYSQVSSNNCNATVPPGTSPAVINQARSLRCEFYNMVYNKLTGTLSATTSTEVAINATYNDFVSRHPSATNALNLLRTEVTNILKA